MKIDTAHESPCEACPYRQDAPVGVWAAEEYEKLLREDANTIGGSKFGCHLSSRGAEIWRPCVGWLVDQKRRGVPSIQLRLSLFRSAPFSEYFERLNERMEGLYESILEMVKANVGRPFPNESPKARRLAKLAEKNASRRKL